MDKVLHWDFFKNILWRLYLFQLLAFVRKYMQFQSIILPAEITGKFENYENTMSHWYRLQCCIDWIYIRVNALI